MRARRLTSGVVAVALAAVGSCLFAVAQHAKPQAAEDTKPVEKKEYDKLSPFEAIRWTDDAVEVELGGIKYNLLQIQDLKIEDVLDYCRKNYGKEWRKAFEEDLVEVLSKMGKEPDYTVKVKMRRLEDGGERVFEQAMLTESNLEMVIKNRPAGPAAGAAGLPEEPAGPAKRVQREHSGKVDEKFKFLTERIEPRSDRGKMKVARAQAEQDLDELEWQLVNRYAYLTLGNVDYKAALDTIRAALGEGIPRAAFALQLHQCLALFGDAQLAVSVELNEELTDQFLPFAVVEIGGGKAVAFDTEQGGFLDLDHPLLAKLDNLPVEKWVEAAGKIAGGGSAQWRRRQAFDCLRFTGYLRERTGVPRRDTVTSIVTSVDADNGQTIEIKLSNQTVKAPWLREAPGRTLEGNVGYLRLAVMTDDPRVLDTLHATMAAVRGTKALVIDVRNATGGSREVLRTLFPYFMAETDPPRVVNVAAHRLAEGEAPDAKEGYLQDRSMFPATSETWSPAERQAVEAATKSFKPEWAPPAGQFSTWHYQVLSPRQGGPYYHYDKPVVVLTNAGSIGAADVLAGAFKGWRDVTLIGAPTAGASGRVRTVRLQNTSLTVRVPSMASFRADGKLYDGKGVEPDVEALPEPTDAIGRTDSVLDGAVKRVQ